MERGLVESTGEVERLKLAILDTLKRLFVHGPLVATWRGLTNVNNGLCHRVTYSGDRLLFGFEYLGEMFTETELFAKFIAPAIKDRGPFVERRFIRIQPVVNVLCYPTLSQLMPNNVATMGNLSEVRQWLKDVSRTDPFDLKIIANYNGWTHNPLTPTIRANQENKHIHLMLAPGAQIKLVPMQIARDKRKLANGDTSEKKVRIDGLRRYNVTEKIDIPERRAVSEIPDEPEKKTVTDIGRFEAWVKKIKENMLVPPGISVRIDTQIDLVRLALICGMKISIVKLGEMCHCIRLLVVKEQLYLQYLQLKDEAKAREIDEEMKEVARMIQKDIYEDPVIDSSFFEDM